MGKITGFMEFKRQTHTERDPAERTKDWDLYTVGMTEQEAQEQGGRCMDCGVPTCHTGIDMENGTSGCPVYHLIPEWNDLVYRGQWREALKKEHEKNNFPEFTGYTCPAPCEGACVLGINEPPVAIRSVERSIIDKGFSEGWVTANPPEKRTGKTVAIVGSGPAGLAAADQLNKAGHTVTVFERDDHIGGLLTYGIPEAKLPFEIVMRRIDLLKEEGIIFKTNTEIGKDISSESLQTEFDSIILCTGATVPRTSGIEGEELDGVHFAMDFLHANTKSLLDSGHEDGNFLSAKDKRVVVIGGGDTGTDCIATSMRHGCKSLTQFDKYRKKSTERDESKNPWPQWPIVHVDEYGHKEAAAIFGKDPRAYGIVATKFTGDENGKLKEVHTIEVEATKDAYGNRTQEIIPGTERVWETDLVFLALGFTGPEQGVVQKFGLKTTESTTIDAEHEVYTTNVDGVFAAGDARRGQSLVVWAINEGRGAARECDRYLMGATVLP